MKTEKWANFKNTEEGSPSRKEWVGINKATQKLESIGVLDPSDEDLDLEALAKKVETGVSKLEERTDSKKAKGVFRAVRGILKKHPSLFAVIAGIEIMLSQASFSFAQEKEWHGGHESKGELPRVFEKYDFPKIGKNYIDIEGGSNPTFLRHNLEKPDSLLEAVKMFVEPIDIVMTISYKKENNSFLNKAFKFLLRIKKDSEQNKAKIFVEFPYEYSRNFNTANPKDKDKMIEEMILNSQAIFKTLELAVGGFTFFDKEIKRDYGFNFGETDDNKQKQFSIKIDNLQVRGFASPEGVASLNFKESGNKELSELRAKNAAEIMRDTFERSGFSVDSIKFEGFGEIPLRTEEKEEILEAAGHRISLDEDRWAGDDKIIAIIRDYNKKKITEGELFDVLEKTIGAKRKVEIEVESSEGKGLLIIPVPLFFIILYYGTGFARRREDENGR